MTRLPARRPAIFPIQSAFPGVRRTALVHALLVAMAGGVFVTALSAQAQSTAVTERHSWNIPAGPLDGALARFAAQSGVNLSFELQLVAGLQSPGVNGRLSVDEALAQMLVGTGLSARRSESGVVQLYATSTANSAVLPAVKVNSSALGQTTEGTNSYTTGAMSTATRLPLSIRETPQSVSVLTRQQMDDQMIVSLVDALSSVTGVFAQTSNHGGSGSFGARGFYMNSLMLDGIPSNLESNGTYSGNSDDMAIYDRVEVVRGANGLTQGVGTPSAGINLVRKRPTDEPLLAATVTGGSWSDGRLDFDASQSLSASGTLRGRVVAAYQDADNFVDDINTQTQLLYGVVAANLSPHTTLTIGASLLDTDQDGMHTGLPAYRDGTFMPLSRSTYLGTDFNYWNSNRQNAFAELRHDFADDWQATLVASGQLIELDMLYQELCRCGSDDTLYMSNQAYRQEQKQSAVDFYASGPFSLLGRQHELVTGASWHRTDHHDEGGWDDNFWADTGPVVDSFNWDPGSVARPRIDYSLWTYDYDSEQAGLYAAARFSLTDALTLIVGNRFSRYRWDAPDDGYDIPTESTPYAGLVFDLGASHSVYASYTQVFQPQFKLDKNLKLLPPITGTNYETGVKGEYLGGRFNANLALFVIRQQNRPVDDLSSTNPCQPGSWGWCQRSSGEVESQGVEFEVSGSPLPGWNITAGYSYAATEFREDSDPANVGRNYDSSLPNNLFKLTTNYDLPAVLNAWSIGGSIYSQSDIASSYANVKQGGYTMVDLHVGYRFSEQLKGALNLNNVFDKHYYETLGWEDGGNVYGEPRSVRVMLRYSL